MKQLENFFHIGFLVISIENSGAFAKINHFLVALGEHQNKLLKENRNEKDTEVSEKLVYWKMKANFKCYLRS